MDTEVYKIRIDQWRKLIYEANTCGMKKTEWCRQNGVTIKQFYYWQKKIRALALKEMSDGIGMDDAIHRDDPTAQLPSFVELRPPAQPHTSSYACNTEDGHLQEEDPQRAELLSSDPHVRRLRCVTGTDCHKELWTHVRIQG